MLPRQFEVKFYDMFVSADTFYFNSTHYQNRTITENEIEYKASDLKIAIWQVCEFANIYDLDS